jgi:hypothetical protein
MRSTLLILLSCFFLFACGDGEADKKDLPPVQTNIPDTNNNNSNKPDIVVNPYAGVDASPMDMSYFPADYPKLKMAHSVSKPPLARIIYSRPHLQGRHVFKEVLKYEQPWRLGANESTELELFADANIMNKKIKAGRYVLYCIPHPESWTIVLNSSIDSWGLEPDTSKDIAKFEVKISKTKLFFEFFTMIFQGKDKQAELIMAWDDVEVRLPIYFQ